MLKSEIELTTWWHCVPCDFAFGKDCPTPKQKATTTLVPHLIGQTCQVIKKKKKKKKVKGQCEVQKGSLLPEGNTMPWRANSIF